MAADAVGGPVTIEDPRGWLLAYSSDQTGGDPVRAETLLGRRAPTGFSQALAARGVPQEIARSEGPVVVRGVLEGAADRLAVGLRAGSFGLGSMWAVVSGAERRQVTAFARIAQRVAVHLMRRRTEDYRTHRVEMEQLAVLLHGGPTVTGSGRLHRAPRGAHWVAALAVAPNDPSERAISRSRLDGFSRRAAVPDLTVHAGQLSNLWYLILTVGVPRRTPRRRYGASGLRDLLDDGTGDRMPTDAGVGSAADDRGGLPRSRKEAEPGAGRGPPRACARHPARLRGLLACRPHPGARPDRGRRPGDGDTPVASARAGHGPRHGLPPHAGTPGWSTRASAPPRSGCTSTRTPCATD